MYSSSWPERRIRDAGDHQMTDSVERATDPEPAQQAALLQQAIDNLSLGLIIFDARREVVFCNKRYMEIYGLCSGQVKPGTPVSDLIRHRLNLGLKIRSNPDEYIRERVGNIIVPATTIQEFSDGRVIAYTVHPMPGGGGMATHEDITGREEINTRLKKQYELGREQEENLRVRNLQFDTAINNMSQGLCFFDAGHRLIVCNDRYVNMYDLPRDRVGPGTALAEIVDMRFAAGSFPAMTRICTGAPTLRYPTNPPTASSNCKTGTPSRSVIGRCRTAAGSPPMRTSPSSGAPRSRSNIWPTTTR
jgi:PAS domain-containing protein